MGRKKLHECELRSSLIGVSVPSEVKLKLAYIAHRDSLCLSTYIYRLLLSHIDEVTKIARIDWNEIFDSE